MNNPNNLVLEAGFYVTGFEFAIGLNLLSIMIIGLDSHTQFSFSFSNSG